MLDQPIEEHHYRSARRLVMRYGVGLGLRSLDAIQLAVALELKEACLVRVRGWEQNLIAASLLAFRIVFAGLIPGRYVIAVFYVDLVDIFQIFLTLTMAWVLFRRVWRTWVERQGLSAEFEAAREMQESLVQLPPVLPGFTVESAYRPASQVGGDFYRIFPADEGAILVVVGDVSGKGLKAAMTVSVLVGAMEAIRTRMPGEFLEEFNHVAKGYMHSGFATCCAVLIHASGEAIIANAGLCGRARSGGRGGFALGNRGWRGVPRVRHARRAVHVRVRRRDGGWQPAGRTLRLRPHQPDKR